jgi:flagellar protein FliJ
MTEDLHTLNMLLGRHERDRDAAIAEHLRLRAASGAAQTQAEQLVAYRVDYERRWQGQFAHRGGIELVHTYQSFTARLTLAVEQQARVAELAKQRVDQALAALRATELRCASVQRLIERRTAEQRLDADRREQKQTDEAASRAAWNRLASTRPAPLL